ncbi:UNVERIFIED_CONTAM: hypothetical protein HHA_305630 [Hammondia hammondi]|eukprot:XP_008884830.1 hypothetical protein HHA_305630 [Hammondia hammondi]
MASRSRTEALGRKSESARASAACRLLSRVEESTGTVETFASPSREVPFAPPARAPSLLHESPDGPCETIVFLLGFFLPVADLCSCSAVCKAWWAVCTLQHQQLWRERCLRRFGFKYENYLLYTQGWDWKLMYAKANMFVKTLRNSSGSARDLAAETRHSLLPQPPTFFSSQRAAQQPAPRGGDTRSGDGANRSAPSPALRCPHLLPPAFPDYEGSLALTTDSTLLLWENGVYIQCIDLSASRERWRSRVGCGPRGRSSKPALAASRTKVVCHVNKCLKGFDLGSGEFVCRLHVPFSSPRARKTPPSPAGAPRGARGEVSRRRRARKTGEKSGDSSSASLAARGSDDEDEVRSAEEEAFEVLRQEANADDWEPHDFSLDVSIRNCQLTFLTSRGLCVYHSESLECMYTITHSELLFPSLAFATEDVDFLWAGYRPASPEFIRSLLQFQDIQQNTVLSRDRASESEGVAPKPPQRASAFQERPEEGSAASLASPFLSSSSSASSSRPSLQHAAKRISERPCGEATCGGSGGARTTCPEFSSTHEVPHPIIKIVPTLSPVFSPPPSPSPCMRDAFDYASCRLSSSPPSLPSVLSEHAHGCVSLSVASSPSSQGSPFPLSRPASAGRAASLSALHRLSPSLPASPISFSSLPSSLSSSLPSSSVSVSSSSLSSSLSSSPLHFPSSSSEEQSAWKSTRVTRLERLSPDPWPSHTWVDREREVEESRPGLGSPFGHSRDAPPLSSLPFLRATSSTSSQASATSFEGDEGRKRKTRAAKEKRTKSDPKRQRLGRGRPDDGARRNTCLFAFAPSPLCVFAGSKRGRRLARGRTREREEETPPAWPASSPAPLSSPPVALSASPSPLTSFALPPLTTFFSLGFPKTQEEADEKEEVFKKGDTASAAFAGEEEGDKSPRGRLAETHRSRKRESDDATASCVCTAERGDCGDCATRQRPWCAESEETVAFLPSRENQEAPRQRRATRFVKDFSEEFGNELGGSEGTTTAENKTAVDSVAREMVGAAAGVQGPLHTSRHIVTWLRKKSRKIKIWDSLDGRLLHTLEAVPPSSSSSAELPCLLRVRQAQQPGAPDGYLLAALDSVGWVRFFDSRAAFACVFSVACGEGFGLYRLSLSSSFLLTMQQSRLRAPRRREGEARGVPSSRPEDAELRRRAVTAEGDDALTDSGEEATEFPEGGLLKVWAIHMPALAEAEEENNSRAAFDIPSDSRIKCHTPPLLTGPSPSSSSVSSSSPSSPYAFSSSSSSGVTRASSPCSQATFSARHPTDSAGSETLRRPAEQRYGFEERPLSLGLAFRKEKRMQSGETRERERRAVHARQRPPASLGQGEREASEAEPTQNNSPDSEPPLVTPTDGNEREEGREEEREQARAKEREEGADREEEREEREEREEDGREKNERRSEKEDKEERGGTVLNRSDVSVHQRESREVGRRTVEQMKRERESKAQREDRHARSHHSAIPQTQPRLAEESRTTIASPVTCASLPSSLASSPSAFPPPSPRFSRSGSSASPRSASVASFSWFSFLRLFEDEGGPNRSRCIHSGRTVGQHRVSQVEEGPPNSIGSSSRDCMRGCARRRSFSRSPRASSFFATSFFAADSHPPPSTLSAVCTLQLSAPAVRAEAPPRMPRGDNAEKENSPPHSPSSSTSRFSFPTPSPPPCSPSSSSLPPCSPSSSSGCASVRGRSSASAASSQVSHVRERGFSVELLATFRTPSTAYFADLLDNQLLGVWTASEQESSAFPFFSTAAVASLFSSRADNALARRRDAEGGTLQTLEEGDNSGGRALNAQLLSDCSQRGAAATEEFESLPSYVCLSLAFLPVLSTTFSRLLARLRFFGTSEQLFFTVQTRLLPFGLFFLFPPSRLVSLCLPSLRVFALFSRSILALFLPAAPVASRLCVSLAAVGAALSVSTECVLQKKEAWPADHLVRQFQKDFVSPFCGCRSLFDVLPLALASRQRRNQASPRGDSKETPAAPAPKATFAFSRALASSTVAASSLSSLSSFFSAASLSSLSTRPSFSRASPSSVGCSSLNSSLSEQRTSPERNDVGDSQHHSSSLSFLPRPSSLSDPSSLCRPSSLSPLSSRGSSAGEPPCAGPLSPALQSESLAAPADPRSGVRTSQARARLQPRFAADLMQNLPAPCMQLRRKADAWSLLDWRGLCVDERGELEIRTLCPIAGVREEDRLMTRPFSALVRQRRREQAEKAASRGYT